MNAKRSLRLLGALTVSSLLAGTFVVACGSDDSNPSPTSPVYTIDGSTGTQQDSSLPPSSDGSAPTGDSSTPVGDSSTPITDTGPQPDVDAAACTQDGGCWSCTPTSVPEFLNQCTGSQCTPFDNSRVPNYDGGTLTWSN
jgi:hypothetical protein